MQNEAIQSEFEIIRRYFSDSGLAFNKSGVELGIGDDAALLEVPADSYIAMSMDVLAADVHFPASADPFLIANRALASNLSDLAAMAAKPFCFTLGLVLPCSDETWLQQFSEGLLPLAKQFDCPLVGGDLSRGPLSITIQVQGLCKKSRSVLRRGAAVGDKIYVSGTLGDAAIALLSLGLDSHLGKEFQLSVSAPSTACQQFFNDAYYKPCPRIELAHKGARLMSSCIDISDGLYGDLLHILEASNVAAKLNLGQLPYSDSALCCVSEENRLRAALYGGDDYELCFTVAAKNCGAIEFIATKLDTKVSCIGEIVAGGGISSIDKNGSAIELGSLSFQHFNPLAAD